MQLKTAEIGGGTVRRTFKMGDEQVFSGRDLTVDEILKMPATNRQALIEKGYIVVFPKPRGSSAPKARAAGSERHVVAKGFGKYDVIEGVKLNDKPLTKEEATAIAAPAKAN